MKRSSQRRFTHRETGFGLVEIMIAMTLGLFVLGGLYEVFLGSKATYRTQEALSRLQENARYAVAVLSRDIRMAGFTGCARLEALVPVNIIAKTSEVFGRDKYVGGSNNVSARGGTDTLTLRGATAHGVQLTGNTSGPHLTIASNPEDIQKNSLVIIADCRDADIFKVTNNPGSSLKLVHTKNVNVSKSLSKVYRPGALVSKFEARTYEIKNDSSATFSDGTPVPALYQRINNESAVELIQGVQDMQIQYGVNSDGDSHHTADEYDNADKVIADSNWSNVVSVRVALLLESLANASDGPSSHTYSLLDAAPIGPFADRRLRRAMTFTVALRNRVH